jgi:hypothetical protein
MNMMRPSGFFENCQNSLILEGHILVAGSPAPAAVGQLDIEKQSQYDLDS